MILPVYLKRSLFKEFLEERIINKKTCYFLIINFNNVAIQVKLQTLSVGLISFPSKCNGRLD